MRAFLFRRLQKRSVFFPIQILIFRMLRKNADVRRCSYLSLGYLCFPERKCIFLSLEENLWTINRKKEFPDFSLTLTISKIFPDLEKFWFSPDVSLTVATLVRGWYLRAKYTDTWIRSVFFPNVYSLYRYKTNIGNWLYAFKIYFHTEYTASKNICFHAKKHVTVRKRWNGCEI